MPVAEATEGMVIRMTLEEMKALKRDYITPEEMHDITGYDISTIRYYARTGQFKFPVIAPDKPGARVKISRIGFINFWENREPEPEPDPIEKLVAEIHAQTVAQNAQNAFLMALLMEMAPNIRDRVQEILTKTGGELQ